MQLDPTPKFNRNLKHFPKSIRDKFYKQSEFLLHDIRHPSLHAKKYDESTDTWQARVDKGVRFYFLIEKDTYTLLDIRYHD
jgi:mRNA-degrading endonuclease RelE of RelBE toxin-antitoxin system